MRVHRADPDGLVRFMGDDPRAELMITVRDDGDVLIQTILLDDIKRKANVFLGVLRLILPKDTRGLDPRGGKVIIHTLRFAHRLVRALSARDDRF